MTPKLEKYLRGWLAKSEARQTQNGVTFNITFGDFEQLWGRARIKKLEGFMADASIHARMNSDNPYAYVLTWKSYAASKGGVMDLQTAQITTRMKSRIDCQMRKGDRHTATTRALISQKTRGVPKSADHRQSISESMKGKNKGRVQSPELRERRRQTALANAAKRREANTDAPSPGRPACV